MLLEGKVHRHSVCTKEGPASLRILLHAARRQPLVAEGELGLERAGAEGGDTRVARVGDEDYLRGEGEVLSDHPLPGPERSRRVMTRRRRDTPGGGELTPLTR